MLRRILGVALAESADPNRCYIFTTHCKLRGLQMLPYWLTVTFVLTVATPVFGQAGDEGEEQDKPIEFEEQVVVTASRAETGAC